MRSGRSPERSRKQTSSSALTGPLKTPIAASTRSTLTFGRFQFRGRSILRRRETLFDERVPLVALRTLPQQLGAAITAPGADVRIQVEHSFARQRHVATHQ